jgi:hypothetical protein
VADDRKFLLEVPVDAAQIADLKPDHAVKVVAYNKKGIVAERLVKLGSKGKATASFGFAEVTGLAPGRPRPRNRHGSRSQKPRGSMRLTVPTTAAFPQTCAYQIQLNV